MLRLEPSYTTVQARILPFMGNVFLVWRYDYEQSAVVAAYETEDLADAHAAHEGADHGVQEIPLRSALPVWEPYYHGMAQVGTATAGLDRQPFVEEAGQTYDFDSDGRVSICPPSLSGDAGAAAVWLSYFDADRETALRIVSEKFEELTTRREAEGPLPDWSTLTFSERHDAA